VGMEGLHSLAGFADALAAVRGVESMSFSKLAANCGPSAARISPEERTIWRRRPMLCSPLLSEKKFQDDGAVFDEGGGHIPIADDMRR